jgi:acyl-CoA thioesterase-1|tara:strand:- start:1097 stop:1744 length:648 start_codon:yes stop_codon:yes gene_type:complete
MRTNLLNFNQIFRLFFVLGVITALFPEPVYSKEKAVVLAFGDSLTAGYGVKDEESYPSKLQEKISSAGFPHKVVNAGVSGDTTAGGVRRIRWLMKHEPEIVILALGANDGLRGLSIDEMRKNLEIMITICREHNAQILLAGMKALPNYGEDYMREFETVFPELAEKHDLIFLPFLLEGVAGEREYTQSDGLHPLASGYSIITDLVWQRLKPMLKK